MNSPINNSKKGETLNLNSPSIGRVKASSEVIQDKEQQGILAVPASTQAKTASTQPLLQADLNPKPWHPDTLSGWITMVVALVSLFLGLYNAWLARQRDRTLVKVSIEAIGSAAVGCWAVRIVNVSRHPVYVNQVLLEDSKGNFHGIPHIVKDIGDIPKNALPILLQQGEWVTYGINNSFLRENPSVSFERAAVRTSTDKLFKSKRQAGGIQPLFELLRMPGFEDPV
jgi:hypothetical protein